MQVIKAKVFRFNPKTDKEPRYEVYEIRTKDPMTVSDILKYIYENIDNSLAFRYYRCFKGVCGSCLISVNGKPCKGCQVIVKPGEEVVIEPIKGYKIIRDLVVDFNKPVR